MNTWEEIEKRPEFGVLTPEDRAEVHDEWHKSVLNSLADEDPEQVDAEGVNRFVATERARNDSFKTGQPFDDQAAQQTYAQQVKDRVGAQKQTLADLEELEKAGYKLEDSTFNQQLMSGFGESEAGSATQEDTENKQKTLEAIRSRFTPEQLQQAKEARATLNGERPTAVLGSDLYTDPALVLDKDKYRAAVAESNASPEAKARAMADFTTKRKQVAEQALRVLRVAGESPLPGALDFPSWEATQPEEVRKLSPEDKALQYMRVMQGRGDIRKLTSAIGTGLLQGGTDIASQGLGVAAMVANSGKLATQAADVAEGATSLEEVSRLEGDKQAAGATTAGGASRLLPPMAAAIAPAALTGGGSMAVSAGLSGLQTAGAQFPTTYKALIDQGVPEEQALTASRNAAVTSGLITSALTAAFGKSGAEAALLTGAGGKELVKSRLLAALKGAAKGAVAEIPEELLDEAASQVIEQRTIDPNKPVSQIVDEFATTAPELAVQIALLGGVGGGVGSFRGSTTTPGGAPTVPVPGTTVETPPDTDFSRRAALEGATEFRPNQGTPVEVDGQTIAFVPEGSEVTPEDVAMYASEPGGADTLKAMARKGMITLPEIVAPVPGVDPAITEEMNENIATSAALAPQTVEALKASEAEGAARNAEVLREAAARLAGTEKGPDLGFAKVSPVTTETETPSNAANVAGGSQSVQTEPAGGSIPTVTGDTVSTSDIASTAEIQPTRDSTSRTLGEAQQQASTALRDSMNAGKGRFNGRNIDVIISPSSRPDVMLQITRLSKTGEPQGHQDIISEKDFEDAIADPDTLDVVLDHIRPDVGQGRVLKGFGVPKFRKPVMYKYRLRLRDAGLGTVPKGFVSADGREVVYDRPLTLQEMQDFEIDPVGAFASPKPTQKPTAEIEEYHSLAQKRGQAQNKVKGVSFSKKEETRFQELVAKLRPYLRETVEPASDPVVGEDINGQPIRQSQTGTFYTFENGRVRTGPAFKEPPTQPTDETPSTQPGESLRAEPAAAGQGTDIGDGQVQAPRDAAAAPAPVQRDQPQVVSLNPSDLQTIPEDLARAQENQQANNERWRQAAASTEPISVIQLPDGRYRILDGHHRVLNAIVKGEQIQAIVEKPWKPAVNEPATFTAANGQKVVGVVSNLSPNGKATVQYVWNGKNTSVSIPASQLSRPITSLGDGPKYVMTQEQNTRKAGKHFPTAPGVHENFDFNKAFASMAADTSLSKMYREIAKLLAKMPAFSNVDLHVVADGRKRYAGEYSHHKGKSAIAVNLRQVARGNVDALGTILHEALHHLTMAKIRDPQGDVELDAVAAIHQLRKKAEKYAKDNGKFDKYWYEFSDNDEFLTGVFTRQDFQEFLASIPSGDIGKFRSLLSEVFRRIAELVTGKHVPAGSTLEQSIASILTLFETPHRAHETGGLEKLSAVRSKPDESARDAEYMSAVESGDVAKQQAMVDEAAKDAGYTVGPVWHHGGFNVEEDATPIVGEEGMHFGTEDAARQRAYGKLVDDFIKEGEVTFDDDLGAWFWSSQGVGSYDVAGEEGFENQGDAQDSLEQFASHEGEESGADASELGTFTKAFLKTGDAVKVSDQKDSWHKAVAQAKAAGAKAIEYKNLYEDKNSTSYIVFDPNQIKSADPITRDENGNVIPLSQRFNEKSNDTRFSLADNVQTAIMFDGKPLVAANGVTHYDLLKNWIKKNLLQPYQRENADEANALADKLLTNAFLREHEVKEGFMVNGEFADRQQALQAIRNAGQSVPGATAENRDWLDSSDILYAAPINPSQSDEQSADDRGRTDLPEGLRSTGTPDAEAGGRADSAKFSPMADARREAAISTAVAENDWGNYTREQKVAAAESFLAERASPLRSLEFPHDVRFSIETGDGSGSNVSVHEVPSKPLDIVLNVGQSRDLDKYADLSSQEVFAHLYDTAQEEAIHVAQYLGMHRDWVAARKKGFKGPFLSYLEQHLKATFDQVNNARIDLQQTDRQAAERIKEAMLASWNIYYFNDKVEGIAGLWRRLAGNPSAQGNFILEMIRQLTQLKRQDFTTETGWQKFQRVLKQWLTDAINALRGVQDIFRSGMAGDLIQKQLADLEAALDGKPLPPAPTVGGTPKSIPEGEPPRTYDVGGEAESADGKGKQLYQKKPTAIGSTYTTPADITLQEKKTQEETLAAARTIIGESVKADGPIKGRRAALDRFRLDTSIPPEVRAVGTGLIAQQADILANLEEGNQQLLLDEMTDEAAKLSGVIASDPDSFKNLKADANLNIDKMAEEAGRTLNIFNVFRRLTPEGFLRRMTRKYNDAVREKVEQNFDVPAEEVTEKIKKAFAKKPADPDKAVKELMKSLKPKPRAPREKIEKSLRALFTADTVGALDDQAFFDAFGEAFGMPPLSDEQQTKIKKLVREINSMPKGAARIDKQQDLDEELALWKGIAARDVLLSAWYSNILSGVSTQGMGLLGNLLNFVPRSIFQAISNPRSAGAYIQGALGEGLSNGLAEAKAAFKGRGLYKVSKYGDKNLVSALELLRKKGPATLPEWVAYVASAGTRLRYVFRIMQAIDALAWNTAREGQAYLAAHRALLENEKQTGDKRSPEEFYRKFINTLGGDTAQIEEDLRAARQTLIDAGQTPDLMTVDRMARETRNARRAADVTKASNRFADRIVMQQEPEGSGQFITSLISVFQNKLDILGLPLGQLLIPFNKIVSNLFEQSLDYTPVGALRAWLGGHLTDVKSINWKGDVTFKDKAVQFDAMERKERAAAAVTGMAVSAAMYALASSLKDEPDEDVPFMIYGWGPESKNRRSQMPKGWVPYSVKMGDTYVKFSEMPFGMMFAAAGTAMDAMRYKNMDKKTSAQRLAYVLKASAKGFMNQGVMSSLDNAMESVMFQASDKKFTDVPVNAAKGMIPAQGLLRDISTIFDDTKIANDSIASAFLRDLPFVKGLGTKPELNVFGEPTSMDGYPIVRRIATQRQAHPVADYLGRNNLIIPGMEQTVEIGKYLPDQMKDRIQRRAVELGAMENGLFTPEQNYEFKKRAGQLTKVAVENIMSQAPKITNEVQRKNVQSLIDKRVEVARRRAMLEAVPVQ